MVGRRSRWDGEFGVKNNVITGNHWQEEKASLEWEIIVGMGNCWDGKSSRWEIVSGLVVVGMVGMGTLAAHSTDRRFLVK